MEPTWWSKQQKQWPSRRWVVCLDVPGNAGFLRQRGFWLFFPLLSHLVFRALHFTLFHTISSNRSQYSSTRQPEKWHSHCDSLHYAQLLGFPPQCELLAPKPFFLSFFSQTLSPPEPWSVKMSGNATEPLQVCEIFPQAYATHYLCLIINKCVTFHIMCLSTNWTKNKPNTNI